MGFVQPFQYAMFLSTENLELTCIPGDIQGRHSYHNGGVFLYLILGSSPAFK